MILISKLFENETMLDMFIFETSQLIEQLEQCILSSERVNGFIDEAINEIFRIMHTIKGSSSMMMFNDIATLAHTLEDIFDYLRHHAPVHIDCTALSDLILESVDFIKAELEKLKNRDDASGDATPLIANLRGFLSAMKQPINEAATQAPGSLENFLKTHPQSAVEKCRLSLPPTITRP